MLVQMPPIHFVMHEHTCAAGRCQSVTAPMLALNGGQNSCSNMQRLLTLHAKLREHLSAKNTWQGPSQIPVHSTAVCQRFSSHHTAC